MNLQGDVGGLIDETGAYAAKYTYNAWGKLLSVTNASGTAITSSTHIANLNPLRYRGYYYDTETGFYYLQSRYYDPVTHRFINADSYASTGQGIVGTNMFTYCGNNPTVRSDSEGNWWQIVVGAAIGGTISAICEYAAGGDFLDVLGAFVWGNVTGAIAATGVGGAMIAAAGTGVYTYISAQEEGYSDGEALVLGCVSIVASVVSVNSNSEFVNCVADLFIAITEAKFSSVFSQIFQPDDNSLPIDNQARTNNGRRVKEIWLITTLD